MASILCVAGLFAIIFTAFTTLTGATNLSPINRTQHGLAIFYPIVPSKIQAGNFSAGSFADPPPSYFECRPSPSQPFGTPQFSCSNPNIPEAPTPESIFNLMNPVPPCLSIGIAFEHFQWATWTHSCWAHVIHAIDTPDGHAEAAFQSTAIAFRELVLYQHDMHVLTLNRRIQGFILPKETEQRVMNMERQKRLDAIESWYATELETIPKHGHDHRSREKKLAEGRETRRDLVTREADAAVAEREAQFWRDTFVHRATIVELDHLIGPYFERWMGGQTQGGWDWAGMGLPDPAWPKQLVVPL